MWTLHHKGKAIQTNYQKGYPKRVLSTYWRNMLVWTLVFEVVCGCSFEFLRTFLEKFCDNFERGIMWNCSYYRWQYWLLVLRSYFYWAIKVLMWSASYYYEILAYINIQKKDKWLVVSSFHSWQINWFMIFSYKRKVLYKNFDCANFYSFIHSFIHSCWNDIVCLRG